MNVSDLVTGVEFRWRGRKWIVVARVGDDVLVWDGNGPSRWNDASMLARSAERARAGDKDPCFALAGRRAARARRTAVSSYAAHDWGPEFHLPSRSIPGQHSGRYPAVGRWSARDKSVVERQMMRIQRHFESTMAGLRPQSRLRSLRRR